MSYIDKQSTINALRILADKMPNEAHIIMAQAEAVVEIMENEDVEPIRHGRWIDAIDHEQCSVCKKMRLKRIKTYQGEVIWLRTPYCDYCGAKMDEEDEPWKKN